MFNFQCLLIYSSLRYIYSISSFYFHLIMTFGKRRNVVLCFFVFYSRIVLSNVLPNLYLFVLFKKRENFANNSIGKLTAQLKSISAVYYSRVSITFSSYCLFNDTITVTVRYLICLEFFFCKPCNARFIFSSKRR